MGFLSGKPHRKMWCGRGDSNPHALVGHKLLSLVQTLVTPSQALFILTKFFLSDHRYAQLSDILEQIGTRPNRVELDQT